jgi:hypothetical protein
VVQAARLRVSSSMWFRQNKRGESEKFGAADIGVEIIRALRRGE